MPPTLLPRASSDRPRRASRAARRVGSVAALDLLSAAAALAIVSFAAWTVSLDRQLVRAAAERELTAAAVLSAEHAAGVLSAADQLLRRAEERLAGRPADELRRSEADWLALRAMAADLPQVVSLVAADATGTTFLGINRFPTRTDVSDRDYFEAHRRGAERHVGRTIVGRAAGETVFTLSRRVSDPEGRFAGIVLASLDAGLFERVYARSGLNDTASFALVRTDGRVIVRHPMTPEVLDLDASARPLVARAAEGPGLYAAASLADGVERLVAYAPVGGFPLVASASVATSEILAEWRRRAAAAAALVAAALAAGGLLHARLRGGMVREIRGRAELEEALAARDALMGELHHRVKNNLQIVASLVSMQRRRVADPEAAAALDATAARVRSLSVLHDRLQGGAGTGGGPDVDLAEFVPGLLEELRVAFGLDDRGISLAADVAPVRTDLDTAVPLGLLVNEAVTNAIKHAFPEGRTGRIAVGVGGEGGAVVVSVRDDGVGRPAGAGDGLGTALLSALSAQIGARVEHPAAAVGAEVRIVLPGVPEAPGRLP
jgi:two-component sensor histidine kinase